MRSGSFKLPPPIPITTPYQNLDTFTQVPPGTIQMPEVTIDTTPPTMMIPTTALTNEVLLPGTNTLTNNTNTNPNTLPNFIGIKQPVLSPLPPFPGRKPPTKGPIPIRPTSPTFPRKPPLTRLSPIRATSPTFPRSPVRSPPLTRLPPIRSPIRSPSPVNMGECCICYDDIPVSDKLKCDHIVCGPCTDRLQKLECPMCKTNLEGPLVTDEVVANILNRQEQDRLAYINADYMAALYLEEHPEANPEEVYRMYRNE
jgi:hypothetical protein